MAIGSSGRRIVVEFIGDSSALKSGVADGEKALQGFSGKAQAAGRIAGKALAGGLLLAGAAAVSATKAAAEDEAAQARLAQQLKQAAGATDAQVASTEDWISKQSLATGVADDELRPALAKLATATGDVEKAQKLTALAMDISAGSGKSLESVTQALAKAQTGSVAGLSKLGIVTKDSTKDQAALEAANIRVTTATQAYNEAVKEHGAKSKEAKLAASKLEYAQTKLGEAQQKTKTSTIDAEEAIDRLSAKYSGSAAKAAETTAGKTKIMQVQFGELQEQIGAKLLPVMTKLAEVGLKVVNWISNNTTTVGVLVGALGALLAITWAVGVATKAGAAAQAIWSAATAVSGAVSSAMNSTFVLRLQLLALDAAAWVKSTAATVAHTVAQTAAAVASKAVAAAQWLLNAAMSANPIGLVVVAIAALVAGLIIAYKHSETFRNIVNAAFGVVKNVVGAVVGWFAKYVPEVFGAVVEAVKVYVNVYRTVITTAFNAVKAVVTTIWNATAGLITNGIDTIVTGIKALPGRIKDLAGLFRDAGKFVIDAMVNGLKNAAGVIEGIAGNVWSAVKSLLNGAISKINAALEFTISLPGPDITVNPPDIPQLAKGGVVRKPTLALIGEDGPEAVVPLGRKNAPKGGIGIGAGDTFVFNIQSLDPAAAGRAVEEALRKWERSSGRTLLATRG